MQYCNLFSSQVAVPEVVEAAEEADILIFVVPHQFIPKICEQLTGHVKPGAIGISLIKVRNGVFFFKWDRYFNNGLYLKCILKYQYNFVILLLTALNAASGRKLEYTVIKKNS